MKKLNDFIEFNYITKIKINIHTFRIILLSFFIFFTIETKSPPPPLFFSLISNKCIFLRAVIRVINIDRNYIRIGAILINIEKNSLDRIKIYEYTREGEAYIYIYIYFDFSVESFGTYHTSPRIL